MENTETGEETDDERNRETDTRWDGIVACSSGAGVGGRKTEDMSRQRKEGCKQASCRRVLRCVEVKPERREKKKREIE